MPLSPYRTRPGWLRLAVILTACWTLVVLGTASWEYLTKNPHDYFDSKREKLFFIWVQDLLANVRDQSDTTNLYFKPRIHHLLSVLLVPIASIWLSLLALIPSFHWIRAGFIVDAK